MSWKAWQLDLHTWGWIFWMAWFAVQEAVALLQGQRQELTEHLRPVFQSMDLTYLLAVGVWLWIGKHFLLDGLWVPVNWPFGGRA